MSIEIRQLVIKSNVLQTFGEEESALSPDQLESIKEDLLAECRRIVAEMMRERGER
jgi:hypothetical protein